MEGKWGHHSLTPLNKTLDNVSPWMGEWDPSTMMELSGGSQILVDSTPPM